MKTNCNKVDNKIECTNCNYPYSEATYPDDYDNPLKCHANEVEIQNHLVYVDNLKANQKSHYWDCKCLLHR